MSTYFLSQTIISANGWGWRFVVGWWFGLERDPFMKGVDCYLGVTSIRIPNQPKPPIYHYPPLKLTNCTWKLMVGSDDFTFRMPFFQGANRTVSFRESSLISIFLPPKKISDCSLSSLKKTKKWKSEEEVQHPRLGHLVKLYLGSPEFRWEFLNFTITSWAPNQKTEIATNLSNGIY